jgi:hypothetical protein
VHSPLLRQATADISALIRRSLGVGGNQRSFAPKAGGLAGLSYPPEFGAEQGTRTLLMRLEISGTASIPVPLKRNRFLLSKALKNPPVKGGLHIAITQRITCYIRPP